MTDAEVLRQINRRLACMNGSLLMAAFAFQRAAVRAWLSLLVVRR